MRRRSESALSFSLAEFVWILFFLSMGALALLYGEYGRNREVLKTLRGQYDALKSDHADLEAEYMIVKARLEKLEKGNTPCWKRTDSPVAPVAAEIIIVNPRLMRIVSSRGEEYSLTLASAGEEPSDAAFLRLSRLLSDEFRSDWSYAEKYGCYLRMRIVNHTERYSLYQQTAAVLKSLGIVVVQEDL